MVSTREGGKVMSDNKAFRGGMIVYTSACSHTTHDWTYFATFQLTLDVRAP
jgi:hypothetical protein